MKKVLTIAGSDCSGGAGIQADIKTVTAHGMYAMSVITSLTSQNTTGVYGIHDVPADFVRSQLDSVFRDIRPDSVKIGMVSNSDIIAAIADKLAEYHAEHIVLDPVMVSTSGSKLLCDEAIDCLIHRLMPLADIITPNIPEAEVLSGTVVRDQADMLAAAKIIAEFFGGAVLIKGGHSVQDATDLLYANGAEKWLSARRIDNPNTHGTGCTLSSAIACGLAAGKDAFAAVAGAKEYLTGALADMLDLGAGSGPLNHMYRIPTDFE